MPEHRFDPYFDWSAGVPAAEVPGLQVLLRGGARSLAKVRVLDVRCQHCDGRAGQVIHVGGSDWLLYDAATWDVDDTNRRTGSVPMAHRLDDDGAVIWSPVCRCQTRARMFVSEVINAVRSGNSRLVV